MHFFTWIKTALVVLVIAVPSFAALSPDDTGCIRWRDTLIVAGIRSLDRQDAAAAERYFTAAYQCGMSKDSMCYFAAEMFLARMIPDTALVFNGALEKSTTFSQELRKEQRDRIYRLMSRGDSLESPEKKDRYEASIGFHAIRSIVALNPLFVLPHKILLSIDPDTQDIGKSFIRFKWFRPRNLSTPPVFATFDIASDLPVATRYFQNEPTDTVMQSYSLSAGFGDVREMPELTLGYRLRLHGDGKADHYFQERISVLLKNQCMLNGFHESKWVAGQLDESTVDLSILMFSSGTSRRQNWGLTFAHHYTRSFLYSDRLDSTSIFRPLPLGFTDSLLIGDTTEPYFRYYTDRNRTRPYTLPNIANYWRGQPDVYFSELPEHDLSASVKYQRRVALPLQMSVMLSGSLTGSWYPEKVTWFTVDNDTLSNGNVVSGIWFDDLYEKFAIIYNAIDGKYYLSDNRTNVAYQPPNLTELHHHKKTRVDGFLMITTLVEKSLANYGTLFFSTVYSKGVSSMKKNEPVIRYDYGWEFTAGWKKNLYFQP